jgi:hypothetical protein
MPGKQSRLAELYLRQLPLFTKKFITRVLRLPNGKSLPSSEYKLAGSGGVLIVKY